LLGSLINLNRPATYLHWGFLQMSLPNLIVIVLMFVVFGLALFLRAPGARKPGGEE
jgi:hypothetical protein